MTTCPSGRDDWPWLMAELATEEDDMPLQAVEHSTKGMYVMDGPYKVRVGAARWQALKSLGYVNAGLSDAQIDALPTRPQGDGGGGPSSGTFKGTWGGG